MRHTDHSDRPPRHLRSFASATTVCAVAFLGLGTVPASAAEGDVAIDIYTINDFHGRLESTSSTAGAAVLGGAYRSFQAANPNSTLVSVGDNVGASTFVSLVQDDDPTIDALNEIGLTVSAVGNHELDKGREDLDGHIIPESDFPYLSANLIDKATGSPAYDAYQIQTFSDVAGNDVTVGFVGATTEDLPALVSPTGIATIDVAPIVESVNAVAADLRDGDEANGEADVVVLLVHEGAPTGDGVITDPATVFGDIVTGTVPSFDAIASAHTHQTYSTAATVDGKTIPVIQTGSYGTNLGHIAFEVNPLTKAISSSSSEIVPLIDEEGEPLFDEAPAVAAIVATAVAEAEVVGAEEIGTIGASFLRATQTDGSENRGGESAISNFVAEAQLAATAELGAQIAFMNPGGIRADLLYPSAGDGDADGSVTYEEAAVVQPFANTLVTETLTGAQIKTVLEQQWQPAGASRPFLKLGTNFDFAYTYDPTAAAGDRITSMTYQGDLIAPEDSFTIVTNSFLAGGGDNFTEFANGTDVADSGRIDLEAFVDYLDESTAVLFPSGTTRSVGVEDARAFEASLAQATPGVGYTVALSSLIIPGAALQPTTVDVLFDGVPIGAAPIDPSIVDTTDEVGRALVTFMVPEDAAVGEHEVVFRLFETGLELRYPVTVLAASPFEPTDPTESPIVDPSEPTVINPVAPPMLAATGVEVGTTIGSGILLLLAGAAMIATRRIRRSQ